MQFFKPIRKIALVLLALSFISGCTSLFSKVGGKFEPGSSLNFDNRGIVVVGKVEIIPALESGEQDFPGHMQAAFVNKALIFTGDELYDVREITPSGFSIRHAAQTEIDKIFVYEESFSDPLIYSGGFIQLHGGFSGPHSDLGKIVLPGGWKYKLARGDKAAYIGTIQYFRDEFNTITDIKIKNEYKEANTFFQKKYGTSIKLKQLKPIKINN